MHSYLLTFASRNKQSFHTFMKLCTTQTKNTNTVNLLITSTHIHVASTVVPGARSVPYPCTASPINHFQHRQSIIDTEREREIDTTNRMRHRQVPFNDKTIGGSHTITRSCSWLAYTSPSDKRYTGSTNLDHVRQDHIAARSRARRDTNTFLDA